MTMAPASRPGLLPAEIHARLCFHRQMRDALCLFLVGNAAIDRVTEVSLS